MMQVAQINLGHMQVTFQIDDEGKASIAIDNNDDGTSIDYEFDEISDANQFLHSCLTAYETDNNDDSNE